jgi:solute carrier family 25 protein 44
MFFCSSGSECLKFVQLIAWFLIVWELVLVFMFWILSSIIIFIISQVSQRLMVQGTACTAKYSGGLDAARKILMTDGVRGLYRGFGMSVMTYSPSSAFWWASYGLSQRIIWR